MQVGNCGDQMPGAIWSSAERRIGQVLFFCAVFTINCSVPGEQDIMEMQQNAKTEAAPQLKRNVKRKEANSRRHTVWQPTAARVNSEVHELFSHGPQQS